MPSETDSKLISSSEADAKIAHGNWEDWADLHRAVKADPKVLDIVEAVSYRFRDDPYAQRYHFWMHYVKERRSAA